MIDDVRVVVPVPAGSLDEVAEFSPDNSHRRTRRVKLRDKHDLTLRVKPIRKGTAVAIEGCLSAYLQGHNVVGTMELTPLVDECVRRVFAELGITVGRNLSRCLHNGRIEVERIDIAGFIDCRPFGGVAMAIHALDVALAGSNIPRMVYPGETVLLDAGSRSQSMCMYFKMKHMQAIHPAVWSGLDDRLRAISEDYLRAEQRHLRPSLQTMQVEHVCDMTSELAKKEHRKALQRVLRSAAFQPASVPIDTERPRIADMVALLANAGIHVLSQLPESTRNRIASDVEGKYKFDPVRQCHQGTVETTRAVQGFASQLVLYGYPAALRGTDLVWEPNT